MASRANRKKTRTNPYESAMDIDMEGEPLLNSEELAADPELLALASAADEALKSRREQFRDKAKEKMALKKQINDMKKEKMRMKSKTPEDKKKKKEMAKELKAIQSKRVTTEE